MACLWMWVVQHGLSGQDAWAQVLSPLPVGQRVGFAAWPGCGEVCALVYAGRLEEQGTAAILPLGSAVRVLLQLASASWAVLPTCTPARTSLLQQGSTRRGETALGCPSSCEGSTEPRMHRTDGATQSGPQVSLISLLICLQKTALNQTCAIWVWLSLQPGAEENGLQRSEGDSNGGRSGSGTSPCRVQKRGCVASGYTNLFSCIPPHCKEGHEAWSFVQNHQATQATHSHPTVGSDSLKTFFTYWWAGTEFPTDGLPSRTTL